MRYLYYVAEYQPGHSPSDAELIKSCSTKLWRPQINQYVPPGLPMNPYVVWWLFHQLHIFRNRDYSIFLIYNGDELVHRSCVFPPYFRFPFMASNDLQIGDTWTAPDQRGKGLATFAIRQILDYCSKQDQKIWYVVEEDNVPSVRVIEKTGFIKAGTGDRIKRMGLGFLGTYTLTQPDECEP